LELPTATRSRHDREDDRRHRTIQIRVGQRALTAEDRLRP
jgi:hypothetical protein